MASENRQTDTCSETSLSLLTFLVASVAVTFPFKGGQQAGWRSRPPPPCSFLSPLSPSSSVQLNGPASPHSVPVASAFGLARGQG